MTDGRTDGWTDGQTDGQTKVTYRASDQTMLASQPVGNQHKASPTATRVPMTRVVPKAQMHLKRGLYVDVDEVIRVAGG